MLIRTFYHKKQWYYIQIWININKYEFLKQTKVLWLVLHNFKIRATSKDLNNIEILKILNETEPRKCHNNIMIYNYNNNNNKLL